MRKIVIVILSCVFNYSLGYSQFCAKIAGIDPLTDFLYGKTYSCKKAEYSCKKVKIAAHVIRKSNSTGGVSTSSIINALLLNDNLFYANNSKISFYIDSYDYIDDDLFYKPQNGNIEQWAKSIENILPYKNYKTDAINIYFLPYSVYDGNIHWGTNNPNVLAYAYHNNNSIILKNKVTTNALFSVITHEIGHILGLYHTHHGTYLEDKNDSKECAELVNGTNGWICGDFMPDTPADPNIGGYVNSSCHLAQNIGFDDNNQLYQPDLRNILSYSIPYCLEKFSDCQIARMHIYLENFYLLKDVYNTNNKQHITNFTYPYTTGGGGFGSPPQITHNNETYEAASTITAKQNVLIKSNAKLSFRAGEKIVLGKGFKVEKGAKFHAYIAPSACNRITTPATKIGNTEIPSDLVSPEVLRQLQNEITIEEKGFIVFPNPSQGSFQISTREDISLNEISVFDISGKEIPFIVVGENKIFTINLANNTKGFYFLRIGNKVEKLIVQ